MRLREEKECQEPFSESSLVAEEEMVPGAVSTKLLIARYDV